MIKKCFRYLSIILGIIFINGCASTSMPSGGIISQERSLKAICERQNIHWEWNSVSQLITLNANGVEATALVDSELILIGEEEITLSEPIRLSKSSILVPADFQKKVISRLQQAVESRVGYAFPRFRKIVLDAGHGGKDPGASGYSGLQEKEVVLDITRRLKRILEAEGIDVTMTRKSDRFVSLQERTEIASKTSADFFISIHANASPVRSVSGVEVFSLRDLSSTEKKEKQRENNHKLLYRHLSMERNNKSLEHIVSEMLYDHKQTHSTILSERVADDMARYVKTKNRGNKTSRFYVLRNTLVPSILVEVGFLSNPKEEKLLKKDSYRQKVAQGLARGILHYAKE